jgi:hypothetical protein
MRRILNGLVLGGGLLLLGVSANAQYRFPGRDDGYYRDDPYYRGDPDWGRRYPDYRRGNGRYGNGAIVDQAISDLGRAASRSRYDGHEEKHFDNAIKHLRKFQEKQYDGKFDDHSLRDAINDMEHLAGADQLRGRDRDMIADDIRALSDLRANRGYGRYSDGYGNGRYGRYDPYGYGR